MQTEAAKKTISAAKARDLSQRKEKLKTRSEWMSEAQSAFNTYIRVRDGNNCISCGANSHDRIGGGVDAGHYRSRGAAGHLRFNLLNCHSQCKKCNRYLSGNVADYRIGLVNKIGVQLVEKLEHDNSQRSFDIEYIKRVKAIFSKRARLYKRLFR